MRVVHQQMTFSARTAKITLTGNINLPTGPVDGYHFQPGQVDMPLSVVVVS